MNPVFADLIAKGEVAVYMDDILIYSKHLKELRQVVWEVLKRLEHYNLYLQPEKCEFEKDSMEYLGMVICPGEVQMDPGKVAAVKDWPTLTMLKEVQAFIGFANFYRRCHRRGIFIAFNFLLWTSRDCEILHMMWTNSCD